MPGHHRAASRLDSNWSGTALKLLYLVAGPPGAGKTTALMSLIALHPDVVRFAVRDFGFELAARGDPLGQRLIGPLRRFELLSNPLVLDEFECFLESLGPTTTRAVIESYPRDAGQAADLLAAAAKYDFEVRRLIFIDVPAHVSRQRVARRRICERCGRANEMRADGRCANCRGPVVVRLNDTAPLLEQRLNDYSQLKRSLGEHFATLMRVEAVDGLHGPALVLQALEALVIED
jgi:adenylate kinase